MENKFFYESVYKAEKFLAELNSKISTIIESRYSDYYVIEILDTAFKEDYVLVSLKYTFFAKSKHTVDYISWKELNDVQ
jgi:hypothetical protein